jgi:cell division protein FtsN
LQGTKNVTQDFAKIRPEPLLERKPVQSPPAWSMMITGIVVGVAIGVFACVLFYLSGNVPALTANNPAAANPAALVSSAIAAAEEIAPGNAVEFEFYEELRNYEVPVDAVPVELNEALAEQALQVHYILQTGAYQQLELANLAMQRQKTLGLDVRVKAGDLPGRTLYLVQSGPYETLGQLNAAEVVLRRNNIPALRMRVQ